jgi:zinc protease
MLDRKTPPPAVPLRDFSLVKPDNQLLANGMPLHVINAGEQPVVGVSVWYKAGSWFAPNKETAFLTLKMMTEGTPKRTAAQITEAIDQYGAFLEFNTGFDHAEIELYCLARHLPQLLALLCELLEEVNFPDTQLDNLRNISIQNLRINNEKTNYLASNKFREVIFGQQHPYGSPLAEAGLKNAKRGELHQYYARALRHQPFEVIATGQIGPAEVEALNQTLGQLTIGQNLEVNHYEAPALPTAANWVYLDRENAMQTSIRIGKPIAFAANGHDLGKRSPDYLPFTMLNEILGGYFGSRLMKNIREEKGLTYGISSNLVMLKNATYLVIGTDVKKELREQAHAEIMKEVQQLTQQPVPADELALVKNYLQGTFVGSLTTPFTLADRFKSIYFHGVEEDYYDHYISRVEAVTAPQLLQLAQQYFTDGFSTVMVG